LNIILHWPQIVWLVCVVLVLGLYAWKHGEPRPRTNYGFGGQLFATSLTFVLLYFGGFFAGTQVTLSSSAVLP